MIFRHNHTIENAITVHTRGGLGNQLFIFCAGLALADQLNCHLYLDPSLHLMSPNFQYHLDQLNPFYSNELQQRINETPIGSNFVRRRLLLRSIPSCCSFEESSFSFDPAFFSLHQGTCLFGYFQSWKYLEQLSQNRINDIRSAIHQLGRSVIRFDSKDIFIHFRRGDYLNRGTIDVHGVLGFDYYVRSINQLRESGFDGNIWSISESKIDDIQTLENTIESKVQQIYGLSIWQDLSLLVNAPSLVIANSTFSWMGGWFGSIDRPVVAPTPWFKTTIHNTSDLIPLDWHTVSHDF